MIKCTREHEDKEIEDVTPYSWEGPIFGLQLFLASMLLLLSILLIPTLIDVLYWWSLAF